MNILRHHSLYFLLTAFLGLAVAVACVEPFASDDRDEAVAGTLTLQVSVPGGNAMTKATAASDEEKALHSLQVWAYVHGGAAEGAPVAYASQTSAGTVSLSFSKATVGLLDDDPVAIDLYVLGNAASAGKQDLGQNSTRDEVRESVISGNAVTGFGKACVETVSDAGLPMSGCLENFDITFLRYGFTTSQLSQLKSIADDAKYQDAVSFEEAINNNLSGFTDPQKGYLKTLFANTDDDADNYPYKWDHNRFAPSMEIVRAVGKIRFVFAKETVTTETVTINRIEFNGGSTASGEGIGLVPTESYLFPLPGIKPDGAGYETITWTGVNNTDLVEEVPPVESLPTTYESSLDDKAVVKTIYLRESDLPLKGRIHYQRGDVQLMTTFDLVSLMGDEGSFPRNSVFTVYVYYIGGTLNIQLTVEADPWDKNNHQISFENSSIEVSAKFVIENSTAASVTYNQDHYDVYLKPNAAVKGSLSIQAPKNGKLIIVKKGDFNGSFVVSPVTATINPEKDGGRIDITINRSDTWVAGSAITLSFGVEYSGRDANADSELIDNKYRFIVQ